MSAEEILDWLEEEVIAVNAHPFGWQFLLAGVDGEPMGEEVLVKGEDFREVCREAKALHEKALQEKELGGAR